MNRTLHCLLALALAPALFAQDAAYSGGSGTAVIAKPGFDYDVIRRLPVLDGQRYKPLDSLAREALQRITGKEAWQKHDPVALVLFLQFDPANGRKLELIKLPPFKIAKSLGFEISKEKDHVSYDDVSPKLAAGGSIRKQLDELPRDEKTWNEDQKDLARFVHRVSELSTLGGYAQPRMGMGKAGFYLPFLPPAEKPQPGIVYSWKSPHEVEQLGWPKEALAPPLDALNRVRDAWQKGDAAAFSAASQSLCDATKALGYPSPDDGFRGEAAIEREVRFNKWNPFSMAFWCYLTAWILALVSLVVYVVIPKSAAGGGNGRAIANGTVWGLSLLAALGSFGLESWGIFERTWISGRAMIGTFYESMIYVTAAAALTGIIFELIFKNRFMLLGGLTVSVLLLWVALTNPDYMKPPISTLQPVLINNNWIHIHVPVMMTGYAVLAVACMLGELYLIKFIFSGDRTPAQRNLSKTMVWSIPVGEIFAFAGIVLGGIWADASWGRFWGWDPKEVGALIMWLVFMVVVHGRWAGWLRDFGTAVGCVAGGWSLLWSYWGTNHFWSGLHSYADTGSTPTIPMWLYVVTGAQVLILVPAFVRWARERDAAVAAPGIIMGDDIEPSRSGA